MPEVSHSGHQPAAIFSQFRQFIEAQGAWTLLLLVTATALVMYGHAAIGSNESSYLILSKVLIESDFLSHDWETGVRLAGSGTSALFDYAIAPLWYLSSDPVVIAVLARVLLTVALVLALIPLVKTMRLAYLPAALGLCLWLLWDQSIAADEWIFGGAEKKVIAYILGFLATKFLLEHKPYHAGVCGGLAAGAHLLVGGWLCVALALATLLQERNIGPRLLKFSITVAVCASPFLLMSILFVTSGTESTAFFADRTTAELITIWRNPHHANPFLFLSDGAWLVALMVYASALWSTWTVLEGEPRQFVSALLAALGLLWLLAISAAALDVHFVMYLFPARIGDVLIPLIFALTFPQAALIASERLLARKMMAASASLLLLLSCVALWMLWDTRHFVVKQISNNVSSWQTMASDTEPAFAETAEWIRNHTSAHDRFIAPGRTEWFKLYTGRPLILTMKGSPGNAAIHEWFCRLYRFNGSQQFEKLGYALLNEVDETLQRLPEAALKQIGSDFSAKYLMTTFARQDLTDKLVHSSAGYHVYQLEVDTDASAQQLCMETLPADYRAAPGE